MKRVTASSLNVRTGPGTQYSVAGSLKQGEIVQPVESEGWLPIARPDGSVEWVSAQYLEDVPKPTEYDFSTRESVIEAIKTECTRQGLGLLAQIAYVLATVEWETATTFKPVKEAFWLGEDWRRKNLRYYPYYGRGYVQLTWEANYRKYSEILGRDFVAAPDDVMEPETALFILVHGFENGTFTGHKLTDYVNGFGTDFVNARRCINGRDRASEIAALAQRWLLSLKGG